MNEQYSVVARLRASKAKHDEAEGAAGRTSGVRSARTAAEYDELRRVAALDIPYENYIDEDAEAYMLACAIADVDDVREIATDDLREIWGTVHDREVAPTAEFVRGFIDGAGEVWDEVADKV